MTIDAANPATEEAAAYGMGEQGDTISAADLFAPEANDADEQSAKQNQADAPARKKQPTERTFTSDDMSRAVQNRLKQERRGAAYKLGRELLDEYMRANNVSEADALARIREERISSKAAEYKADPEKGFRELMQQREQRTEPEDESSSSAERANQLYTAIVGDINDGKVPQGFDLEGHMADRERAQEFIELYEAFGMEKACKLVMRMYAPTPTKTELNRALPKPVQTNNSYSPANVDFMAMSSEEFRAYDAKMKKARAMGKRII